MDTEFEAELLRLVDDFLTSDGEFGRFIEFKDAFIDLYSASDPEAARLEKALPDAPIVVQRDALLGQEIDRRYHDRLPLDRRAFFDTVAERLSRVTRDAPDARAQGHGYRSLTDSRELIRRQRNEYRAAFGV